MCQTKANKVNKNCFIYYCQHLHRFLKLTSGLFDVVKNVCPRQQDCNRSYLRYKCSTFKAHHSYLLGKLPELNNHKCYDRFKTEMFLSLVFLRTCQTVVLRISVNCRQSAIQYLLRLQSSSMDKEYGTLWEMPKDMGAQPFVCTFKNTAYTSIINNSPSGGRDTLTPPS